MPIEDSDKVDKIVIERATGKALLAISDHLPWDVDEGRHLELLQTKVYRYLDPIESRGVVSARAPDEWAAVRNRHLFAFRVEPGRAKPQ